MATMNITEKKLTAWMQSEKRKALERLRAVEEEVRMLRSRIQWIESAPLVAGEIEQSVKTKSELPDTGDSEKLTVAQMAEDVLQRHPGEWVSAAIIADEAVSLGLWVNPPDSYKTVMISALKRALKKKATWLESKPKTEGSRQTVYRWVDNIVDDLVFNMEG